MLNGDPAVDRFCRLGDADGVRAMSDALVSAAAQIDFPFAQAMVVVPAGPRLSELRVLDQSQDGVIEFDRAIMVGTGLDSPYDIGCAKPTEDPVIPLLRKTILPIHWSATTYLEAGLGAVRDWLIERDRAHGMSVRIPVTLPELSRQVEVVVSLQRKDPISERDQKQVASDVVLLAVHAAAAADRVLTPRLATVRLRSSPLTAMMQEYLRWAERGKSVPEIAEIAGRSAATVRNTLHEARDRLNCSTTAHAVKLAKGMGWF